MAKDKKKIVFLTGTRADFGKLKSLLLSLQKRDEFDVHVFATGMHLNPKYGETVNEIKKSGLTNIYKFINHGDYCNQDIILSKTVNGFSDFVGNLKPDMIVVHGDRTEALSGALVGSFNNILVSHIEGGELTGSIDEHIRHSVSKLSHLHFVANEKAKKRLLQMGEDEKKIFVIGSPDIDIMLSDDLPNWAEVKNRYEVPFDNFALLIYHPVTSELSDLLFDVNELTDAVLESGLNYVVIYANNDPGTDIISSVYKQKLSSNSRFLFTPSMRFEYFLTLLKNARFILGNSSAGIREAPYYSVPTINVGNRQNGRIKDRKVGSIYNCGYDKDKILALIRKNASLATLPRATQHFGSGNSDKNFLKVLSTSEVWKTKTQKQFLDIDF